MTFFIKKIVVYNLKDQIVQNFTFLLYNIINNYFLFCYKQTCAYFDDFFPFLTHFIILG